MSEELEFSADYLLEARRELNLTQTDLGELIGAHRSSIARWESGDHRPTMKQVKRLAEALKKEPKWFFNIDRPPAEVLQTAHVLKADPWLRQFPWERIQQLTASALGSQGMSLAKIRSLTGLGVDRLRDLTKGALPQPDEVLALRKGLGERFDPTPTQGREIPAPSGVPKRVQQLDGFSEAEKLEFLLQKVNRMELEIFTLKDQVSGLLGE